MLFLHLADIFKVGIWKDINSEQLHPDLESFRKGMKDLVKNSKAKNTNKLYESYFKQFSTWCAKYDFTSLPATDFHVALYLSSIKDSNPSASKINAIVYSVSWFHSVAGLSDPCSSKLVQFTKEGLLRTVGRPVVKREHFSIDDMHKIFQSFKPFDNLENLRFIVMCFVSYSGFLRFDELIKLRRSDIVFDDRQMCIFIPSSKGDQYQRGARVVIARTGRETCPVNLVEQYLQLTGIRSDSNEFLFRKLSFCKSTGRHVLRDGSHISYTRAREILLSNLESIGFDKSRYGLHSFRSSGASVAANAGVPDRVFKKHGRWRSENAKDGYIRESDSLKRSVTLNLGV